MIEKVAVRMNADSEFEPVGFATCDSLNPKELLLCSAAKCAAMTALGVMHRGRLTPRRFEVSVSGRLSTDELRAESVFTEFNVVYDAEAPSDDEQLKISWALNLAHEKYCGLVKMLRQIAPVSHETCVVVTETAGTLK